MTLTREIVNNICASILSGIIAPLSFDVSKNLIPTDWSLCWHYILPILGAAIILFVIWWFFDWRQKYAMYRQSFKIGYWTGVFASIFILIYFALEGLYRIYFLFMVGLVVILIKLVVDGMNKVSKK